MSYDPFDGVLLNDPRPPVSGAVSLMLRFRVARRLAKAQGRTTGPSLEPLKARSQACRELLVQGLLPATLRELQKHGLDLGLLKAAHSQASVLALLEAYLKEVEAGGYRDQLRRYSAVLAERESMPVTSWLVPLRGNTWVNLE